MCPWVFTGALPVRCKEHQTSVPPEQGPLGSLSYLPAGNRGTVGERNLVILEEEIWGKEEWKPLQFPLQSDSEWGRHALVQSRRVSVAVGERGMDGKQEGADSTGKVPAVIPSSGAGRATLRKSGPPFSVTERTAEGRLWQHPQRSTV